MLKHVVFFKFKRGIGEEEIADLEKSLAALTPVIPEITKNILTIRWY